MPTDTLANPNRHAAAASPKGTGAAGRWWKPGLLAAAIVVLAVWFAALRRGSGSAPLAGPLPTHTIARGELVVTVTEQGTLESSNNTEIKCKVRGQSTIIWVIDNGTEVEPGDVLVRLDTKQIEDAIAERTKYAHLTRSSAERARADVARAELAIPEYVEGRYQAELMNLQKDLAIAESDLRTARNLLAHAEMMAERGYVSQLDVDQRRFMVKQAELNVEVKKTEIDVLTRFTKAMELETLKGNLEAAKARLAAEEERAKMDAKRRDLALEELQYCTVRAPRRGLVIYPATAQWKDAPEIEEGATVHKDQVLLLMPDLTQMQVKVGIHESVIDHIRPGMHAKVTLPDQTLDGEVTFVSPVTRPAGWWTGNVVKYDTIIRLPSVPGLKPGMSAEVEVILDRYENVLLIPTAAVVETNQGDFCWVKTPQAVERRRLKLGAANDQFLVVEGGVREGEQVVLDPLAVVQEAQSLVLRPADETRFRVPAIEPADAQAAAPKPPDR